MSDNYVIKIARESQERDRVFANTNYDSMTKDYWYQLSRISINAQQAAFLIANISPKAKEDSLNQEKRSLLADARMLIDTCQIESMSASEWLRWANEHSDSPPDLMKEKERLERVLLAFDRNPGKQQKAELEGLQQALERERAKNREISRMLENTKCALDAARQGEEEARAEIVRLEIEREKAKEKPSHMLAIAGLLELVLDNERPRYNQGSVAQAIEDRHHWYGASVSQLTKIFPLAKDAAKKADGEVKRNAESL